MPSTVDNEDCELPRIIGRETDIKLNYKLTIHLNYTGVAAEITDTIISMPEKKNLKLKKCVWVDITGGKEGNMFYCNLDELSF